MNNPFRIRLCRVVFLQLLVAVMLLGVSMPAYAVDADGFVFPVLGTNQTDSTKNTTMPAGWYITQGFGDSIVAPGHLGEDWAISGDSAGKKVYSIADGVIKAVFTTGSSTDAWGPAIIVEHTLPIGVNTNSAILAIDTSTTQASPTKVYSLYAHLKQGSLTRLDGDGSDLVVGSL